MPGLVYRGSSAEAAAMWKDGKLLDKDGVEPLLTRRGAEWFPGRSSTPAWRQRGELVFRGASSETYCRIAGKLVYRGSASELLYEVRGEALMAGRQVVVRGAGLTAEELIFAGLVL